MLTWGPYYPPPSPGGISWRTPSWMRRLVSRMTSSSAGRPVPQTPEREALIEAAHLKLQTARQAKLDATTPAEHAAAMSKINDALDVLLDVRGR